MVLFDSRNGLTIMKRFAKPGLFLLLGIACGVPLGHTLASRGADEINEFDAGRNPDSMNITLPRDYFAQLPKSADGRHRLVSVETFTFNGESSAGLETGSEIVLPRFDVAEMSDSYRERFMELQH